MLYLPPSTPFEVLAFDVDDTLPDNERLYLPARSSICNDFGAVCHARADHGGAAPHASPTCPIGYGIKALHPVDLRDGAGGQRRAHHSPPS